MLAVGTKALDFSLPDQNGELHTLEEYKGKKLILYFYPKDNTPGCTKQACGFGELYPQITEKGAVVVGISKDSVKSHKNFETKYSLHLPCYPTRRQRPSRPTMSGRRRKTTGRPTWEL